MHTELLLVLVGVVQEHAEVAYAPRGPRGRRLLVGRGSTGSGTSTHSPSAARSNALRARASRSGISTSGPVPSGRRMVLMPPSSPASAPAQQRDQLLLLEVQEEVSE